MGDEAVDVDMKVVKSAAFKVAIVDDATIVEKNLVCDEAGLMKIWKPKRPWIARCVLHGKDQVMFRTFVVDVGKHGVPKWTVAQIHACVISTSIWFWISLHSPVSSSSQGFCAPT